MKLSPRHFRASQAAFTMMEIAICLAIIGIALLGIIRVLPIGMNVQKDNRESTVINQDATIFIEAIRNGERGSDDLTNYVYGITNYWAQFNANGALISSGTSGYDYYGSFPTPPLFPINKGSRIVGLLSTPKYLALDDQTPVNNLANGGYSNHFVAYVHSLSGPAVEKPPQDNDLLRGDSFSYRIICENTALETDTNMLNMPFNKQLAANLRELRLTFLWPQQPNGALGAGRQTYRTLADGQITQTNDNSITLYFFQPQSFTNAPPSP
jgi:prepilin-type N-terminal cleavage/methylation domain-containing protein